MIIDFLGGAVVPRAMDHAKSGARYVQMGSAAEAASTITGAVLRNKLLTLVGDGLFATPVEAPRPAYAQLAAHALDGKLTVDLERTRLEDISGTWEHPQDRRRANSWSRPGGPGSPGTRPDERGAFR